MAFEVEYFQLSAGDISNKYVDLSGTPVDSDNVTLDSIGGTAQAITNDFGVDGTRVRWDSTSYALYNQFQENDRIRIIYDRS